MDVSELLVEEYGRLPEIVRSAVEGLSQDKLTERPGPDANTIAWLLWHLTRVQDHHVAELLGDEQVYLRDGWHERFGRGPDPEDHGYGHSAADVASVQPGSADDLVAYYEAVHARTISYLGALSAADLDAVVDDAWDPPVTLGVRLASILTDDLEHAGQAAFVRGLLHRT